MKRIQYVKMSMSIKKSQVKSARCPRCFYFVHVTRSQPVIESYLQPHIIRCSNLLRGLNFDLH